MKKVVDSKQHRKAQDRPVGVDKPKGGVEPQFIRMKTRTDLVAVRRRDRAVDTDGGEQG